MTPPRPRTRDAPMQRRSPRAMHLSNWGPRETYLDLVVLADGHGADVVLLPQLLGERGRHDLPAHVRGSIEVAFAVFATVRGHEGIELHGDRLQRAVREGSKGRSVGCQRLPSIRHASSPPECSTRGGPGRRRLSGGWGGRGSMSDLGVTLRDASLIRGEREVLSGIKREGKAREECMDGVTQRDLWGDG